jgi:hypothetical protein
MPEDCVAQRQPLVKCYSQNIVQSSCTTLDDEIENTPNLALCADLFVALESYPDQAYTNVHNVIEKHFPNRNTLFSHYQMKN